MKVSVDLKFDLTPAIAARLGSAVGGIVEETAALIEGLAKTKAPVRTGALRNSIQSERTGEREAVVRVGVDYGIYQEFGTSKMAAHPYLMPAAEEAKPRFEERMRDAVREACRG
jgi:HK97 gp10 family phage protein